MAEKKSLENTSQTVSLDGVPKYYLNVDQISTGGDEIKQLHTAYPDNIRKYTTTFQDNCVADVADYNTLCQDAKKVAKEDLRNILSLDVFNENDYADTVVDMLSDYYIDRFKAEYKQLKVRCEKLENFCTKLEAERVGKNFKVIGPKHDCPEELLVKQLNVMKEYLHILEVRAVLEGLDLNK